MPLSVTVKTLDSQNHQVGGLDDDITVLAFKQKIATTVGIAADCQRLIYCGRVLRDDKKLSEYGVDGKVIHLVQRNPNIPSDGPDPVSASEARARGASPARGRAHHHHIHIQQQQPGFMPSMTYRLNIARDLLGQANNIIARLENPNAPQSSPPPEVSNEPSNAPNGASAGGARVMSSSGDMSGIPAQVAQAMIQSAFSTAMQSMASTPGRSMSIHPGHFEMSVSIEQNGQIISQSGPNRQQAGVSAPPPTSTAAPTAPPSSSSATASGRENQGPPRQLQHPPLSELADAMDELSRTEERFQPFRQRMYELLRSDPTFENDQQGRQDAQQLFNRATEVMHLLSHIQHALSDAVVNWSQNSPRHIRASPLVIQSRSTVAASIGGPRSASAMRTSNSTTSTTSTSTSATNTASVATNGSSPRPMEAEGASSLGRAFGEVEVNVEPIIVGIEMEPEIGLVTTRSGFARPTTNASSSSSPNLMGISLSLLNAARGDLASGGSTTATSSASSSSTSASVSGSGPSSGQDSQARGGAQTQPTTSTQTRSSAHIHYAPRGPFGLNLSPLMVAQPTFDPLLPCNSHHIATRSLNRRTRHPAGHLISNRPRSASVPPRGNGANANQQRQEGGNPNNRADTHASSARSSPQRIPRMRPFSNLDFEVSTHIDVVPMIMTPQGVMAFGSPRSVRPDSGAQQNANSGGGSQDSVEPSLAGLLGSLQASNSNDNASMLNVVMGIMNEISGAIAGGQGSNSGQPRTISSYLEGLPDYTYVEGESLVTDLLMQIARTMTFNDLVSILLGSSNSLSGLQVPTRQFLRRHVLVPPNDDEEHDIDAAVLHVVDVSYPHFEAMAQDANVRPDIDFAETLHSFMAANLSSLAETVLRTSTPEEFSAQFQERGNSFLSRLTILCLRCFVDGFVSLERVVRNRLDAISGDVGNVVREWILSAGVGHLRNYVAGVNARSLNNEDIDQYLVRIGDDAEQRKAARRRRLQQHQVREDETFVTPRSSPPRGSPVAMDVDENSRQVDIQPKAETTKPPPPPPSDLSDQQTFPSSLLAPSSGLDSTLAIGSQAWHGTVPADWVPIVTRDISRQNSQESQRPFSDAYVSTQSAKRRRLASKSKPEGNVEQMIADTLDTAIRSSGVEPINPIEEVIQEASGHASIQESMKQNFQTNVARRINNDPDFDADKFPNSRDFANNPGGGDGGGH